MEPLLLLTALGCAARRAGPELDPFSSGLAAADAAWSRRADEGIAPSLAAYEALLGVGPDPRVYARLARAHAHAAVVTDDPAVALGEHETAREIASRCLAEDPEVAAALPGAGWRWTEATTARVEADRADCLLWAVVGAVGTVEVRGPGALLELEGLGPLLVRAEVLLPGDPWILRSAALVSLLDPRSDASARGAAVSRLEQAQAAEPGLLLFAADLAAARGEPFTPEPPVDGDPWRLENDAIRRRSAARSR